jgi:putative hemolysin
MGQMQMQLDAARFQVGLAKTQNDVQAAQHLRYQVFVQELKAAGPQVDHDRALEMDRFDACADHLIVRDTHHDNAPVVGVYRLMRADHANRAGQFYCADEYDLSPLIRTGKTLLEMGRSCIHPAYRGGPVIMHLWAGLEAYITTHAIDLVFGVASFHDTDPMHIAHQLSLLHARHLADASIRPKAHAHGYHKMDIIAPGDIDRLVAMRGMPTILKSYLRLNSVIGDGAFIDHAFNCIDVCVIMQTTNIRDTQRAAYRKAGLV